VTGDVSQFVRVLVVDDEPSVRVALDRALRADGYVVHAVEDGISALERTATETFDAILLDVSMPYIDGFEVTRRLRLRQDRTPILMLTARDDVNDRVAGLDAGADDYLVKPFALRELLARVRALLRRIDRDVGGDGLLTYDDVEMNVRTHEVRRGERRIELTRTEWSLLQLFLQHPEQLLTRPTIFDRVWGYDFGPGSNTLSVYIGYLRRKLEPESEARLLHTVRSLGYILRKD
jgi:two-component system, OmpR family, response regulator MprA